MDNSPILIPQQPVKLSIKGFTMDILLKLVSNSGEEEETVVKIVKRNDTMKSYVGGCSIPCSQNF